MKVIIVGGGIGGLAAAIGLGRAGHKVKVFERSTFTREVGAAINVCPNASRILLQWGFDPRKSRMVTAQEQKVVVGSTLKTAVKVDCSNFAETYGGPFFFAHRVDLHNELRRLATQSENPVEIAVNSEVKSYDPDGSVTLEDGSVHAADLIVAADGVHSIAAKVIIHDISPAVPTGQAAFRFLIPTEQVASDSATAALLEDGVMKILTGPDGRRLVWYPCADGTLQNFVGIHPTVNGDDTEDWDLSATTSDVIAQYKDFHPTILSVVKQATSIKRWPLLYREPISSWTKGRLVLVGDAAHPMLPHQGQGGAQAIEDAGALYTVFKGLAGQPTEQDIQDRLKIFETVRLKRASAIQVFSNAGQDEAEKVEERVKPFMAEGQHIPKTPAEYMKHNFGYDVLLESEALVDRGREEEAVRKERDFSRKR